MTTAALLVCCFNRSKPQCFRWVAGPVYLNTDNRGQEATSSDTHRRVDAEVTRMLREAYSRVTTLLVCHVTFHYFTGADDDMLISMLHAQFVLRIVAFECSAVLLPVQHSSLPAVIGIFVSVGCRNRDCACRLTEKLTCTPLQEHS